MISLRGTENSAAKVLLRARDRESCAPWNQKFCAFPSTRSCSAIPQATGSQEVSMASSEPLVPAITNPESEQGQKTTWHWGPGRWEPHRHRDHPGSPQTSQPCSGDSDTQPLASHCWESSSTATSPAGARPSQRMWGKDRQGTGSPDLPSVLCWPGMVGPALCSPCRAHW